MYILMNVCTYVHTFVCTYIHTHIHTYQPTHSKNKITNFLVITFARNSGNCNLIGRAGCYDHMAT